jgi:hypothetical protein
MNKKFEPDQIDDIFIGNIGDCQCGCTGLYIKPNDPEFLPTLELLNEHFRQLLGSEGDYFSY